MLVAISWREGCQIHELFPDPFAGIQGVVGKAAFQKCSHVHYMKCLVSANALSDFYVIIFSAIFCNQT